MESTSDLAWSDPVCTPYSDEDALAALSGRDENAFRTLLARHRDAVNRVALSLTGDRALAEDVVQEVFLVAWTRPDTYRPAAGSVRSWLLAITRHRAVDRVRAEVTQRSRLVRAGRAYVVEDAAGSTGDVATEVAARVDLERRLVALRAALRALPTEQQEVLRRMYWDHQSGARIAGELDVPLGTVKTRALLAKRRLRQLVA